MVKVTVAHEPLVFLWPPLQLMYCKKPRVCDDNDHPDMFNQDKGQKSGKSPGAVPTVLFLKSRQLTFPSCPAALCKLVRNPPPPKQKKGRSFRLTVRSLLLTVGLFCLRKMGLVFLTYG